MQIQCQSDMKGLCCIQLYITNQMHGGNNVLTKNSKINSTRAKSTKYNTIKRVGQCCERIESNQYMLDLVHIVITISATYP